MSDPLDTCYCGDYRRDHDEHGCKMCRNLPTPWSSFCPGFRPETSMQRVYESASRDAAKFGRIYSPAPIRGKQDE